jgi:hypothetical protein
MIFRNRRQFFDVVKGYHPLNGALTNKINVVRKQNSATKEFKHPFYTHDKFSYQYPRGLHSLNINVVAPVGDYTTTGAFRTAITSTKLRSANTVVAVATIQNRTTVSLATSHVTPAVNRYGYYNHDLNVINGVPSSTHTNRNTIYSYESQYLPSFIPRNANTNIYADESAEDSGGDSGGLTITQYWS